MFLSLRPTLFLVQSRSLSGRHVSTSFLDPVLGAMISRFVAFEALQGLPRPARDTHGSLKVAAHVLVKPWLPRLLLAPFTASSEIEKCHRRYTSCAGSQSKSFTWFLCAFY